MRRVLAPLRRCFADDGRRTRLRALYEDAALARGSDAAVIGETDPSTIIADRKIDIEKYKPITLLTNLPPCFELQSKHKN